MNTFKLVPNRISNFSKKFRVLFVFIITLSNISLAEDLKVMKMGLGSGNITTGPSGINCGGDCNETFTNGLTITLTATPLAGSTFLRWEGDLTGTTNPVTLVMNTNRSVRAVFGLSVAIPPLTIADLTPTGIRNYLNINTTINTAAKFIAALPREFRQNWLLMTRSESLQTGTAEHPRILMPSADAKLVFTIGLVENTSYPSSHHNAIEFMQWDPAEKNFRFHEIVLDAIPNMGTVPARTRMISIDDSKCTKCHSTQNIPNNSTFPGTTGDPIGIVKAKNKPNWDTYDSWAGLMPFNRDRIYQGSVEAAAFRKLFNLWTWRADDANRAIIEQLELQPVGVSLPHSITRLSGGQYDGHIKFGFDLMTPILIEPLIIGNAPSITSNYLFNRLTGTGTSSSIIRGGDFVTLHHSDSPTNDEGRAVQLFDLMGGADGEIAVDGLRKPINAQRIVDELINHKYATGSFPIDVRSISLAISQGILRRNASTNTVESTVPGMPLTINQGFFTARGMSINDLFSDTQLRSRSLPRRKADLQKLNLDRTRDVYILNTTSVNGLIQQYGSNTLEGNVPSISRIRQEVFRRPIDAGNADETEMGGVYVDREDYVSNTETITLFRYFLEPLGVSVDKWSMGVRGRSRTYTFADVFGSYLATFRSELNTSLGISVADPNYRTQLITAVNNSLSALPLNDAIPHFTDVQRIFNKSCIECHGGLDYPPYSNFSTFLDFSENENPTGIEKRLDRSHNFASVLATSIYSKIINTNEDCNLDSPVGLMPCGGPSLSKTDIETIRRWIIGGKIYSNGDPHIKTVDGINYDFQATGEFVLLKGENFEMQARHTPVKTESKLGPNAYTGLTSCVSINGAFAMKLGVNRITYQPNINGKPDPSGLQLRINGEIRNLREGEIQLEDGVRIIKTIAPGGIQIEAMGGTTVVVTPSYWDYYKVWYMNIDAHHVRATQGLMGSIAPANWLPALPNGTLLGPRPESLLQRNNDLYNKFGNAWRVNDETSLFDYGIGFTSKSFAINNWSSGETANNCNDYSGSGLIPALKPLTKIAAENLCGAIIDKGRKANCIQDVMITGEPDFAKTYLISDKITSNNPPSKPSLTFPADFEKELVLPVKFTWDNAVDKDGDLIKYKIYVWPVNEMPNNNNSKLVSNDKNWMAGGIKCAALIGIGGIIICVLLYLFGLKKKPFLLLLIALLFIISTIIAYFYCPKNIKPSTVVTDLESKKSYFWKVIAEDGKGGSTESDTWRFETK